MKKKMLRSQLVTLRVPREVLKRIDILALQQEKYRSELFLEALKQYLERDRALERSGKEVRKMGPGNPD